MPTTKQRAPALKRRGPAKGHGGRPRGSGKPTEALRVPLSCRVAPETLAALKGRAADAGVGLGALIDRLAQASARKEK